MDHNKDKEEVFAYWDEESCGTGMTKEKKFSHEYFSEIENKRYALEPCIKPFAQFNEYKNKNVLEVGVGAGTDFLNWLRYGAIASGIDLTDEAIENVKHRLNIECLQAKTIFSDAGLKIISINNVLTWCDLAIASRSVIVRFIHRGLAFIGGGNRVGWFMLIKAVKGVE